MAFGVTFGNFTFEELRDDKFDFATYDTADQVVESTLNEGSCLPGYGLVQNCYWLISKLFNEATYKDNKIRNKRRRVYLLCPQTQKLLFGKAENDLLYMMYIQTPLLALGIEAENEEFIQILDHRKNMLVDAITVGEHRRSTKRKYFGSPFDKFVRPVRDYVGFGFVTGKKYDPDNPITDERKVNQAQRLLEAIVGYRPAREEGLLTDQRVVETMLVK